MKMFARWSISFVMTGTEAMLDRALRTCFTVGVGIEPTYYYADIEVQKGTGQFVLMPMIKAEFGLAFAKQALKLRLSANPGRKIVYLDRTGDWYHSNLSPSDFRLSGQGQYALSLVWMVFAHKWSEAAWYR